MAESYVHILEEPQETKKGGAVGILFSQWLMFALIIMLLEWFIILIIFLTLIYFIFYPANGGLSRCLCLAFPLVPVMSVSGLPTSPCDVCVWPSKNGHLKQLSTYVPGFPTLSHLSCIVAQPPPSSLCCQRPPSHYPFNLTPVNPIPAIHLLPTPSSHLHPSSHLILIHSIHASKPSQYS